MPRSLRPAFARLMRTYLRRPPVETPEGLVAAELEKEFYFGTRMGPHESAHLWHYTRKTASHQMLFGFVPYGDDYGLFTAVGEAARTLRPGRGASLQLRVANPACMSRRGGDLVLCHHGSVTKGRGSLGRARLAELVTSAAPEAAEHFGDLTAGSWPIEIGSTADMASLLDRLFVYSFALEQAKRLHGQETQDETRPLLTSLAEDAENQQHPGQGYGLTPTQRRAVELHAEDLAAAYFVKKGYRVRRVGKPYDLECTKGGRSLRVEVKGTTTGGQSVELTVGEVEHARHFDRMALFVVSDIAFDRNGRPKGGKQWVADPWTPDAEALTPLRFRYVVPRGNGRTVR